MTVSEYYTFKARLLRIESDLVQFLSDIAPDIPATYVHEPDISNQRLARELFSRACDANVCLSAPYSSYRVEKTGD